VPRSDQRSGDQEAEKGLLIAAGRGDGAAFEELAALVQGGLYTFILRMIGSPEEAEDLTQEVLLKLFRTAGRFDPRRSVRPWMYRIARNAVIDHVRTRKLAASLDEVIEISGEPASGAPTPAESFMGARDLANVAEALGKLPAKYREVLLLRYMEHFSYKDISAALGKSVAAVESRLHRGKQLLRKLVENRRSFRPPS